MNSASLSNPDVNPNLTRTRRRLIRTPRPVAWPGLLIFLLLTVPVAAQTLLNVDFGVGSASRKTGFAATGQTTNDFWNLYRHYDPKYTSGMPLVADGQLEQLKFADGQTSAVAIAVSNAPGVWGNATGDPMYDTYLFARNGSNSTVTVRQLDPGRYHFYLYGHADADVTDEQNSAFTLRAGTNTFGPLIRESGAGSKFSPASNWPGPYQYVVFRDVPVAAGQPVEIEVAPGPNGVAVLNGMQIISRGTSPPTLPAPLVAPPAVAITNLIFHEVRYAGRVTGAETRFEVSLAVESLTTNEISEVLFEGDVAVLAPEVPDGLRLLAEPQKIRLYATRPGHHRFKLEVVPRITRAEPWNQISFAGPPAAVASVQVEGDDLELQLLSGVASFESSRADQPRGSISGVVGADRLVSLRWQSKAAEVTRKSLVTVDTAATALITPTVIKFATRFQYEILQAPIPRLILEVPAAQAVTRLQGEQIRDWQIQRDGERQLLSVEFLRPVEKAYTLTLHSEQAIEATPATVALHLPQPLEVERESGSLIVAAEETVIEIETHAGLRQVNAPKEALLAYRFHGRPLALETKLRRIEPVIHAADRVTVRQEETRLLVTHALTLKIEKAGLYALELSPPAGFAVADTRGEGVEDWRVSEGKLHVNFGSRVLGSRQLEVQLEQPHREFPAQVTVGALRIAGATRETAQIGAAAAPGIQLKTAELNGLREVPITSLPQRTDELLAFIADQGDWNLSLSPERLAPRIVAEVFNLLTVGDGLVGGSATIRYGIINQGVQEFRLRLPAHWKNVEFTGPNIRRKELIAAAETNSVTWAITLQDKTWAGYTLVITYDYQFDPKRAVLDARGAHPLAVEREAGSVAITTAASLQLAPRPIAAPLRVLDPAELPAADLALIARPVLLAYGYTGDDFHLDLELTRHEQIEVLNAVTDRTQLTTVLTDAGEMLTQATFMVKNNDKQFQKFQLPPGAQLWACYVNNEPVKAEQDGGWLMVSLPRAANRDEAFAVDLIYAQQIGALDSLFPKGLKLAAPQTDVPNTYAEWELYVPADQRLSRFAGSMSVARGTTYGVRDAWRAFTGFYARVWEKIGEGLVVILFVGLLVAWLIIVGRRRGAGGVVTTLVVFCILAIVAGMLLPALGRAKAKSQRIKAISQLKQIGLAAKLYANDNDGRFPNSFEEMMEHLISEQILIDPASQTRFVYVGAGKTETTPQAIIAFSPVDQNGRAVALADGSVAQLTSTQFAEAINRDATQMYHRAASPPIAGPVRAAPGAPLLLALPEQAAAPTPAQTPGLTGGAFAPSTAAPMATGIRSIRIELPRTGKPFQFTKVLNVRDEPLSIQVSVMKTKVFNFVRMVLQLAAFAAGLLLAWIQWLRRERSSFWMTVGLALALAATGSLFIAARALHVVLIVLVPVVGLALLVWVIRKVFPRRQIAGPAAGTAPVGPDEISPVLPSIGLAFLLVPGLAIGAPVKPAPPVPATEGRAVSIISGDYRGVVRERAAQFEAVLQLSSAGTNQTVRLFGEDIALQDFAAKSGAAKLLREGKNISVFLPERGEVTLQFKLVAPVSGDVSRRNLAFSIPPALASRMTVTIDEAEADVGFPSAVAFKRTVENSQTHIEAIIGLAGRVEMHWTPRVKRAAEIATTVFAENSSLVTVGGGVLNTRTSFDYQVMQGELRQARVRLPAGQRLLRVEGDAVRVWELKSEAAGDILTVDLLKGMSPGYRLTVETEKPLETLPARPRLEVPQALDVNRETGLLAVRASEEVTLAIESAQELQRVDVAEFARASKQKTDGLLSAWRFLRIDFQLIVRAEMIQPQIEATVRNHLRLAAEQLNLSATVDYTIKQAGVFALKLALPAGYRVESVQEIRIAHQNREVGRIPFIHPSGTLSPSEGERGQPVTWSERVENGSRLLEVSLPERTLGAYALRVELVQHLQQLPPALEFTGVHPLGAQKVSGFVSVAPDLGVSVKTTAFEGLTEIPAAALDDARAPAAGSGLLAFKFISAEPQAGAWKLNVAVETVEPWVRAEIAHLLTVSETLASGRASIRYDIQNAPVKEFRLRVPAAWRNVEITGANIRRRDREGDDWRVELQNKVRGAYSLNVTWDEPRETGTNVLNVTGLIVQGVDHFIERETGFVIILAKAPLQVLERAGAGELIKIDAVELPEWIGISAAARTDTDAPVLTYRYLRPGYQLDLTVKRFDPAALLQALIESADLTTVVADDGQMMTRLQLSVRNNGRQFLEIELPKGAEVWSAFVAERAVRPSRTQGRLLFPLERSNAEDAPIMVELIYAMAEKFPRRKGDVKLVSPKFDVPFKNAKWDLYLPPDYDYERFGGTMTPLADSAPVVRVYSLAEYGLQERQSQQKRKSEMAGFLSNVKSQLAGGNIKEATEAYNRARGARVHDEVAKKELAEVERKLHDVQGNILLEAQNAFQLENALRLGEQARLGQKLLSAVDYDADTAARQWEVLQKAQEIAVSKVQPLRVNLPTRGLHHTFSQVLQTEVNKPMTVEFVATSTRQMGWLQKLVLIAGAFLMLWLAVAVFARPGIADPNRA